MSKKSKMHNIKRDYKIINEREYSHGDARPHDHQNIMNMVDKVNEQLFKKSIGETFENDNNQ